MAKSHLRRPAAGSMAKPSVKGLTWYNRWSPLAMPEEEEGQEEEHHPVDPLSSLPDDVLLNIVERLGFADAARTSILSRRWKQIPSLLSKILIMVGSTDCRKERKCDDVVRANATMLGATRSLLENRSTSPYTIHRLGMQFYLGDGSIRIGRTFANTIATHKVGVTEFTILSEKEDAFSCLTRLKLENLRLGESDFPKIFRLCNRLEFLRLDNCDMGFRSLLVVEHPCLCEIEIVRSDFERIDLNWLPELTKLTICSWISQHDPLSFGYVPLLHTLCIRNTALTWHKMQKLSEFLCKVTVSNLHLGFENEKIWVKPEDPRELWQVFSKLRLVNLAAISKECDLTWTMFVLHGAPYLEELCIRVCDCLGIKDEAVRKKYAYSIERKDAGAKWEASDFKHCNLSVLRIFGFQSEDKFVNYATTIMKAAVNLKDIYLHEKPACKEVCAYRRQRSDTYPRLESKKIWVRNSLNMHECPLLRLHFRY